MSLFCIAMKYSLEKRTEQSVTDLVLMGNVANGDEGAQRELLARISHRIHRTCLCLSGSSADADDLSQSALIEILRAASSFRGESSLEYWADRITVQSAAKQYQKKRRRRLLKDTFHHPGYEVMDVDEQAALSQARDRINGILAQLPYKQRVSVVLHHLHGYDVPEIAKMIDTKESTIRARLRIGLQKLRKKILADTVLKPWIEEVRMRRCKDER